MLCARFISFSHNSDHVLFFERAATAIHRFSAYDGFTLRNFDSAVRRFFFLSCTYRFIPRSFPVFIGQTFCRGFGWRWPAWESPNDYTQNQTVSFTLNQCQSRQRFSSLKCQVTVLPPDVLVPYTGFHDFRHRPDWNSINDIEKLMIKCNIDGTHAKCSSLTTNRWVSEFSICSTVFRFLLLGLNQNIGTSSIAYNRNSSISTAVDTCRFFPIIFHWRWQWVRHSFVNVMDFFCYLLIRFRYSRNEQKNWQELNGYICSVNCVFGHVGGIGAIYSFAQHSMPTIIW